MGFLRRLLEIALPPLPSQKPAPTPPTGPMLSSRLQENLLRIGKEFGSSPDILVRDFQIGAAGGVPAGIVHSDGLADKAIVQQVMMRALMLDVREFRSGEAPLAPGELPAFLRQTLLTVSEMREAHTLYEVCDAVLSGDTALFVDGYPQAFIVGTRGWKDRGIPEPQTETVIRGPRDGFTETLRSNTMLIRRRIKDTKLRLEMMKIGRVSKTDVGIMFIEGIAEERVIQEVRRRLRSIDIDAILESGYIEELIQDEALTPFPTMANTERPDVAAAGLLEGRVAIIVDGTPFVLLVPCLFNEFYMSAEDYYERADISTGIRYLRLVCFFIALIGPSAYIAITTFHQEMLPTELLIGLASSREGIPFPAFIEALIMEVIFEILREAGVRMPRMVGQAMSIVGALVLGQAAIQAGLVSPAMVIVVSLTAITNFVIPHYSMAISVRMLRFVFMALAAGFGLFGILFGVIFLIQHLCSLYSFGVPYMAPYAPMIPGDIKDSFLGRLSWKRMSTRPKFFSRNKARQKNGGGDPS
ncbi:spore germination protein KA [Paenibacillus mucilaginosus]|uniref:spore germination protein n=1 Tax=Paenibacillus mucilaginosus TaxID=61624 RepID=UPI003D229103